MSKDTIIVLIYHRHKLLDFIPTNLFLFAVIFKVSKMLIIPT
jgi:hypothetical protein